MNREELNRALETFGFPPDSIDGLVWVASDSENLTGRQYNFVPLGDGRYEILKPGDRGDYFPAVDGGEPFVGTLEEAYDWVFAEEKSIHEMRSGRGE